MSNPHHDCKYFAFHKLDPWCRHPTRSRRITLGFDPKCDDHVNLFDLKVFPGQPLKWPKPVTLEKSQ